VIPAILLKNPLATGLGALAALAVAAAGVQTLRLAWAEGEISDCKLAREEERRLAEKAKADALQDAQLRSDAIVASQAEALAKTAAKAGGIIERIIHVPVTNGCGPVMRDASRGVHELFGRQAGGGAAEAERGAPAALPRPGADR
jgi:hypothetical protein